MLNREDMLRRLEAGEDPLELSIEKWQDIVDGKGVDEGSGNCALCEINKDVDRICSGCVVYEKTGEVLCFATPYRSYMMENCHVCPNRFDLQTHVRREVEFLKSLRKKEE